MIVYFGSRAEARPASKMPNLVMAEAASSDPIQLRLPTALAYPSVSG
jgi:hypothetical protein